MCGVPAQTLRDRIKGYVDPDALCKTGPDTTLTQEQEEVLVSHVETMAELGYGYSNNKLKHLAGEMAYDLKAKQYNKPMSNNWLYGFLRRWSTRLSSLKPSKLETTRAKSSTPEKVEDYFKKLELVLTEHDLLNKPQFIYNLDETGLQPEHRPPNIIGNPKTKCQAITSPRSTTTTLIGCINALGHALPPYFVFKGKRFNPDLLKGSCVGTKGVMSDSGWSNSQLFQQYLEEHFLPYVRPCASDNQPILLIYDGHTSHKSPSLISWAKENNLILFVLPAHTSHILQPLDVAVFGPLKNYYYAECSSFMNKHMGQTITRFDICSIACKAYTKAMSASNIQSAFRKTGIHPLNPRIISAERLFPCESFREERPVQKVKVLKTGKAEAELFIQNKELDMSNNAIPSVSIQVKKPNDSRPNAGGRAITDDDYIAEVKNYEQHRSQITLTPARPKVKRNPRCLEIHSPKPSTSGLNRNKTSVNLPVPIAESDTEDDDIVDETEVCCICKRLSPPDLKKLPMLKIVNWAQCDTCGHWTHLAFCTQVRVVRRLSTFLCPHCQK